MRWSALACLVLPVLLAAAGDDAAGPQQPKSPKAKAALKKYDRALEKAKEAYDREVAKATKDLRAELEVALKAAMQSGSLDEATAIRDAKPAVADPATPAKPGLVIVRAAFGVDDQQGDVTEAVRRAAAGGTIKNFDRILQDGSVPDPAPNRVKSLRILGRLDGRPFELFLDGGNSMAFTFGPARQP